MINTLIIEDELTSSDLLSFLFNKYIPEVNVVACVQTVNEALVVVEENEIDLVFLDINLGTNSGFEFLKKSPQEMKVIITSAHEEYALEAIRAQVMYYLLKPILIDELIFAVKLFNRNSDSKNELTDNYEEAALIVNSLDKIDIIKLNELMYVTSTGKYSTFVLSNEKSIVSSTNIGEYYARLPSEKFLRIHNSYIVNIDFVNSIQKGDNWNCVLPNNILIPISRRKRDEIIEALSLN